MPTDRELIDALCFLHAGWRGQGDCPEFRAYQAARRLVSEHARSVRSLEDENAILAEAEAIRARRNVG